VERLTVSLPDEVYNALMARCEAQSLGEVKVMPSRVVCEALVEYLGVSGVDIASLYVWGGRRPGSGRPPKEK
jgi:hypothetical protein